MKYQVLKELISMAELFEAETNAREWRKEQFVSWLLQSSRAEVDEQKKFEKVPAEEGLIAMFIAFMYRYAEFYSRRLFKDTNVYSLDDFGVLATLYPNQEFRKVDILRQTIQEKSSGNEVLKRLLKVGLLGEKDNPEDKRSKLLFLTDDGRLEFEKVRVGMVKLSKHVTGDLTSEQKSSLLQMLFKLHEFHKPVFERADEEELQNLVS